MFTQTWKKYLPVIVILLKRSVNGEQKMGMNHTDFERAASGRKIKFTFSNLQLTKGRMDNTVKHTPLVKEFVQLLLEEEQTRGLIRSQNFIFTLNNSFELLIKNTTEPEDTSARENGDASNSESDNGTAEINDNTAVS